MRGFTILRRRPHRSPAVGTVASAFLPGVLLLALASCGGDGAGAVSGPGGEPPDAGFALETMELGSLHACGTHPGGVAYCWGTNSKGHLGTGEAGPAIDVPTRVAGDLSFVSVAAGDNHTCGLTSDGAAYCWGWDTRGQRGDGQAGERDTVATPAPVVGGLAFEALTAGRTFTCGLTADGVGYCWGDNGSGQLGIGTSGDGVGEPLPIQTNLRFELLDAGSRHACGLTSNGQAYCWGRNANGQLGVGSEGDPETTPVAVAGDLRFASLSAGGAFTCGVAEDGSAHCWGNNGNGALGDGNAPTDSAAPVAIEGDLSFRTLAAGSSHVCGVTTSGAAYCWGFNGSGQLGDGEAGTHRDVPTAVVGGLSFEGAAGGEGSTCARTEEGEAYCWGANDFGQLGDGNEGTPSDRPVRVADPDVSE